jgi:hypothetical protein
MMVWACFTGAKVGPLIVCDAGSVNADRYLDILRDGVVAFTNDLLNPAPGADTITVATDDTLLFMHDNAPCHTAKKVTEYLKKRRLPTMKWLAQSPDLNPIENLWVDLKSSFHKAFWQKGLRRSTAPDNLDRCAMLLKELWRDQGMKLINNLVESMPTRVAHVLAARGGHTKY